MPWVAIKDYQPQLGQWFAYYARGFGRGGIASVQEVPGTDGPQMYRLDSCYPLDPACVTHWCLLPGPPPFECAK